MNRTLINNDQTKTYTSKCFSIISSPCLVLRYSHVTSHTLLSADLNTNTQRLTSLASLLRSHSEVCWQFEVNKHPRCRGRTRGQNPLSVRIPAQLEVLLLHILMFHSSLILNESFPTIHPLARTHKHKPSLSQTVICSYSSHRGSSNRQPCATNSSACS